MSFIFDDVNVFKMPTTIKRKEIFAAMTPIKDIWMLTTFL